MPSKEHFSQGPSPVDSRPQGTGYEPLDADASTVVLMAGVIASGVALCLLIAGWFYHLQTRHSAGEVRQTSFRNGASQRTSISTDWVALDRENHLYLEPYGWVDRSKGIVRVPITRAMELLVAEAAHSSEATLHTKGPP